VGERKGSSLRAGGTASSSSLRNRLMIVIILCLLSQTLLPVPRRGFNVFNLNRLGGVL
jgi:hypothetical protein